MKTLYELDSRIMQERISFSKNILGPIFYEFCHLLHEEVNNNYNHDTDIILYMARDGLRLRYLYQLYRQSNNLKCKLVEKDFYISRFCCAKSCLYTDFDYVFDFIMTTEHSSSFTEIFESIIKAQDLSQNFRDGCKQGELYIEKLKNRYQESYWLKSYFLEHNIRLKKYLDDLLEGKQKIILVDSGGSGTTQGMLMRSFSQYEWIGLYFYAKSRPKNNSNNAHLKHILGVSSDEIRHNKYPRSCIFSHSLLIEAVLKIDFPSTEEYQYNEGKVMPINGIASESTIAPNLNDKNPYFLGIIEYFKEQKQFDSNKIHNKANEAYKHLFRLIKFPRKSELSMMDCSTSDSPEVLKKSKELKSFQAKRSLVKTSPWRSGQTTLEFPLPIARLIQLLKIWKPF